MIKLKLSLTQMLPDSDSLILRKDLRYDLPMEKKEIEVGVIIRGSYSKDLNISSIHNIIRDIFGYHIRNTGQYLSNIEKSNARLSKKQYLTADLISSLRSQIEHDQSLVDTFSEESWKDYCDQVKDILDEYDNLTTYTRKKKVFRFGTSKSREKSPESEDLTRRRLFLIKKYLSIAERYIEFDVTFHSPFTIGCDYCGTSVDDMKIDEDQGGYICECDGVFSPIYSTETSHIDPDRIDVSSKISYDDRANFIRRLRSYQGFHNRKISQDLLNTLDRHLQDKYGHPPVEEIKKMPLDENGHRGGGLTSVPLLKVVLQETNNSIHFQDINNICYDLWGWEPPQIDHLIPTILEDYTRTQEVYKRLNPDSSSINVELRLYWHLRMAGHNCPIEDFKIPNSRESRKKASDIFRVMCEETGLKFIPII